MHCNMPECSYGLKSSVCLPNSLNSPFKRGIVYDLITGQMRRWEAGTNMLKGLGGRVLEMLTAIYSYHAYVNKTSYFSSDFLTKPCVYGLILSTLVCWSEILNCNF